MKVGFVSRGSVKDFKKYKKCEGQTSVLLFGFGGIGEVSYQKELNGQSAYFQDVALLSKQENCVVICGCITDTLGHRRISAIVAEEGKILGISDAVNAVDDEMSAGAELRVYSTKIGRIGVVVAHDLYFPDVVRSLCACGCEYLVCPFGKVQDSMQSVLLRAYAYCYGIPIFFCGKGYSMLVESTGKMSFSSPQSPVYFSFTDTKRYHLIRTRSRGNYPPKL